MGLSINPLSPIFKWIDSKKEANLRIAEYLENIADEAATLAMIWQQIVERIIINKRTNVLDNKKAREFIGTRSLELVNAEQITRLGKFYDKISTVLGDNHNCEVKPAVFHIGTILLKRDLTKKLVESELATITQTKFYSEQNDLGSIKSMEESVKAIHAEAAALHVYAKSFRANIK